MERILTTSDLHENTEVSIQPSPPFDLLETSLPAQEFDKDAGVNEDSEVFWMEEQTIIMIVQTVLLVIFCVVGTLANSLVFWVFNRRPALRSLSNRFVLSLVTANILISSIVAPLMTFQAILNEYFKASFITQGISTVGNCVVFSAIFSTFLIATDRFYAVTSPLHYSMTITRSRSQVMIMTAWLSGACLALPNLIAGFIPHNTDFYKTFLLLFVLFQVVVGYLLPFGGLCWLYLRMYHAAHRNSERTRKHSISGELLTVMDGSTSVIPPQGIDFLTHYMNPFARGPMAGSIGVSGTTGGNGGVGQPTTAPPVGHILPPGVVPAKKHRRRSSNGSSSSLLFREEGRAVKTALLVLTSFLLCWTPHFAYIFMRETDVIGTELEPSNGKSGSGNESHHPMLSHDDNLKAWGEGWLRFAGVMGVLLSCLLNPFIYVFRNKMACKEVSKLLCKVFRDKKGHCEKEPGFRERSQQLLHQHCRDHSESTQGMATANSSFEGGAPPTTTASFDYQPKYSPCLGKSPKRSSLKSLTTQTSLTSITANGHALPTGNGTQASTVNGIKPPFLRSLTVPEQSQPRVKFPPNLVRQKSCVHRPVYGGSIELTPALSRRSKFVRQDSICSIISNDSVLMICEEDGMEKPVFPPETSDKGGEEDCMEETTNNATSTPTPLDKHYLRQDSNFSDASRRTNDSGVVLSTCPSTKPSANNSPALQCHLNKPHNRTPSPKGRQQGECSPNQLPFNNSSYSIIQTTI